jgi:hypothetical protein
MSRVSMDPPWTPKTSPNAGDTNQRNTLSSAKIGNRCYVRVSARWGSSEISMRFHLAHSQPRLTAGEQTAFDPAEPARLTVLRIS